MVHSPLDNKRSTQLRHLNHGTGTTCVSMEEIVSAHGRVTATLLKKKKKDELSIPGNEHHPPLKNDGKKQVEH